MRINVFFGLCLLAITVSTTYGGVLDSALPSLAQPGLPSLAQPALPPLAPPALPSLSPPALPGVPAIPSPLTPCPGKRGGLIGLLQQILYLVNNILSNVGGILSADSESEQGLSVIPVLRGLLAKVRDLVVALLGGTKLTNPQVLAKQAEGANLVAGIKNQLDSLLGQNAGNQFACTAPNGLIGGLLDRVINLLGIVLNGVWSHDRGLVSGLLGQIVATVNSVLSNL